jgi:hypothetical protein
MAFRNDSNNPALDVGNSMVADLLEVDMIVRNNQVRRQDCMPLKICESRKEMILGRRSQHATA